MSCLKSMLIVLIVLDDPSSFWANRGKKGNNRINNKTLFLIYTLYYPYFAIISDDPTSTFWANRGKKGNYTRTKENLLIERINLVQFRRYEDLLGESG